MINIIGHEVHGGENGKVSIEFLTDAQFGSTTAGLNIHEYFVGFVKFLNAKRLGKKADAFSRLETK
ncbi:MAG: hypothetical protein OXE94_06290 [Aestuariivita sp.]|nr:hypothetical protein [Aestuariivita sp.]MCY4203981.1 hypothetical protein [Aestuariivita sp.]MCY4289686.1 hypothetical protein [Aestuariivita sp.]MCY4348083.1 hypothetical protein [Aestuariivita sp.]